MNERPPDLSWVVPLYRNGGFAAELLRRTQAAAAGLGLAGEVVFVDDACPERSGRQAEEAARGNPGAAATVLTLPGNQGQDAAVRAGLRACRGRQAMVIDGDLQDPPEMLGQLWPVLAAGGIDVVFASRHGDYEPAGRLATSRIYRKAMEWIGGLPPGAGVCALLGPAAIRSICRTRSRRLSLLAVLAGAGLRMTSVRVRRDARADRRTAYSSWGRATRALHSLGQTVYARWLRLPL